MSVTDTQEAALQEPTPAAAGLGAEPHSELGHCPVCRQAASSAHAFFKSDKSYQGKHFPSTIMRCACSHGYLAPMPDDEVLAGFYDAAYHCYRTSADDGDRLERWIRERHMGEYFNHVRIVAGGRYLDIGCGTGDMVAAMSRLGMRAEGVEPSAAACSSARAAGLQVFNGFLHEAGFAADTFDSVSMFHALEHTRDPAAVLGECERILRPGGELLIGVPNIDSLVFGLVRDGWVGLQLPTHLQHFSCASLSRLGERAGLQVEAVTTESLLPHVKGELAAWLRRRFLIPGRVSARLAPLTWWARRLARKGEAQQRGESIVARFRKPEAVARA